MIPLSDLLAQHWAPGLGGARFPQQVTHGPGLLTTCHPLFVSPEPCCPWSCHSLVFHSLDKITSAFIHITPVTLTYLLR